MKKKLILSLIFMFLLSNSFIYAIDIKVNGILLDTTVSPQIVGGRTFVPISDIAKALDTKSNWDSKTKTVTLTKNDNTVEIQIDNPIAKINGIDTKLDSPAKIINGKAMVPVNFIATAFGSNVSWDKQTKTVIISSDTNIQTVTNETKQNTTPTNSGSGQIKGNVNSKGEKIYHMPGWRDYNKVKMKPSEGDTWFETEEEAINAGFRKPNYI